MPVPPPQNSIVSHCSRLIPFIIQQIVAMPIYGKEALNICQPT